MIKKIVIMALIMGTILPAFSRDVFEAGVSLDNEIQKKQTSTPLIPPIENGFYDLYYVINFKPLDMLSVEEAFIKKTTASALIAPLNSLVATPSSYNISLSTGKVDKKMTTKKDELLSLLQKDPENPELLFAYAIKLKNEKDYKKAMRVVNVVLEKDPDFALAHFLKAGILRQENKLKESVDEYLYAVELNPYMSDAYYNIAKILEMMNDRNLAMDYYKMAYKVSPNDLEIKDIILKNYVEL